MPLERRCCLPRLDLRKLVEHGAEIICLNFEVSLLGGLEIHKLNTKTLLMIDDPL